MAVSTLRSLAAASLAVAAAAIGPCIDGTCAAADAASLLQRPDEGRNSMWKVHNSDPEADPTLVVLGVAERFEQTGVYQTGDPDVFGKVTVSAFKGPNMANSGMQLCYNLLDVDRECERGPAGSGLGGSSCGIQLRSGTCAEWGETLWSRSERVVDPWGCITYVAQEKKFEDIADVDDGDEPALVERRSARADSSVTYSTKGTVSVYTGLAPESIKDAVVVIHDHYGAPMSCAPVVIKGKKTTTTAAPALVAQGHAAAHFRPLRATNFVKMPGWTGKTVWGEVLIFERKDGNTAATLGQLLTWDLEDVDNGCAKGQKHFERSCGIQVEEGTCDSPPSAPTDMWDKDVVDRNPWDCISYTSLWTHRTVKAAGRSITAYAGMGTQEMIGQVVIVYSSLGLPMACADILFE